MLTTPGGGGRGTDTAAAAVPLAGAGATAWVATPLSLPGEEVDAKRRRCGDGPRAPLGGGVGGGIGRPGTDWVGHTAPGGGSDDDWAVGGAAVGPPPPPSTAAAVHGGRPFQAVVLAMDDG